MKASCLVNVMAVALPSGTTPRHGYRVIQGLLVIIVVPRRRRELLGFISVLKYLVMLLGLSSERYAYVVMVSSF
jgi:hypothetical protein